MADEDHVEPQDESLRNSAKTKIRPQGETFGLADTACYWNDKKYSDGASVCDAHQRYKCWSGKWVDIGNC